MRRAARVILVAIFGLMLGADAFAPYRYDRQFREEAASPPTRAHPLGTDALGRDRLSRLLHGGRISILLAPAATLVSVGIALTMGLGAALLGPWWGRAARVAIDLFLSLPWLFLLLTARGLLPLNTSPGVSIAVTFALLGFLGWPGPARVMMAAAERQSRADYVLLARAGGGGVWRVAVRHILPNLAPVTLAQFWTTAPAFLLAEANLALLGLGISEPLPSWGNLLRDLQNLAALPRDPAMSIPLLLLVVTLGCCQLAQAADEYPI
ncbi:MAG: ABC transporter permease subunit [Acidobacteriia bacterium]|nr:ABC transporter permease subunit [Terriglobia bacterium]